MCNCIDFINAQLKVDGSNTMIEVPILFNFKAGLYSQPRAKIVTCKRDSKKREKPKSFFASYCPFCGEKYKEE